MRYDDINNICVCCNPIGNIITIQPDNGVYISSTHCTLCGSRQRNVNNECVCLSGFRSPHCCAENEYYNTTTTSCTTCSGTNQYINTAKDGCGTCLDENFEIVNPAKNGCIALHWFKFDYFYKAPNNELRGYNIKRVGTVNKIVGFDGNGMGTDMTDISGDSEYRNVFGFKKISFNNGILEAYIITKHKDGNKFTCMDHGDGDTNVNVELQEFKTDSVNNKSNRTFKLHSTGTTNQFRLSGRKDNTDQWITFENIYKRNVIIETRTGPLNRRIVYTYPESQIFELIDADVTMGNPSI
jgi:hypothetical protein